ncbi:MAG: zinc ribbon domain-containing protein [Prevotella sp.]|nr:zinc ribbon domain-containing protein [Alistipes senegalensis]MCM1357337.1 zinc ribbon domain-containing protein [Prevotella sp.]MCM1474605.1 zinc ribbon domain-containing protein [Muribaculaceae bacterium]MDE6427288.1 zinc ribbon domain-containing protein [Ruminococcus sp.]
MGIIDKFNDAQRVVAEKSKTAAEVSNLKRKILYEEERIVEIFADIGKKYYKNPNDDPASFKILCDDIDTRRRRIKRMRYELNNIKGYKICPKCDAEVNDRFQFCGRCGARLPEIDDTDFTSLEPDYYTESSDGVFNADSTTVK